MAKEIIWTHQTAKFIIFFLLLFVQLELNAQSNVNPLWTKWSATETTDTLYYSDGDLKMIKFVRIKKRPFTFSTIKKHQYLYQFFDECGNLREKDTFTMEIGSRHQKILKYRNKKVKQSNECDTSYVKLWKTVRKRGISKVQVQASSTSSILFFGFAKFLRCI